MSSVKYLILIILVGVLLSACKSTVETITTDRDTISSGSDGYLLIGVDTTSSLRSIELDGPSGIKLSHKDLRQGSNFILIDLAAGEYVVEKVNLNRWFRVFLEDEENWKFNVKPQTISYVGHLEISNAGFFSRRTNIELVNRSTEAIEFMEDEFPSILQNRVLHYGGPGEDFLFELINEGVK